MHTNDKLDFNLSSDGFILIHKMMTEDVQSKPWGLGQGNSIM